MAANLPGEVFLSHASRDRQFCERFSNDDAPAWNPSLVQSNQHPGRTTMARRDRRCASAVRLVCGNSFTSVRRFNVGQKGSCLTHCNRIASKTRLFRSPISRLTTIVYRGLCLYFRRLISLIRSMMDASIFFAFGELVISGRAMSRCAN